MPGAGAGFLAGLVEGIGGSVLEGRRRKVEEDHRREEELSSLYLKSVFNGDLRPEVGFGEFAKIVAPILGGDDAGKGKGKGGGILGGLMKHLKEPENMAGLLTGLHKGMGVVPPSSGTAATPNAPTTEGENGNLPSRSTMVEGTRGQTPQGLAGLLVSPEERDARAAKTRGSEAEAGALGVDRGRMRAADELSHRYKIPIDEAMQRVGLKQPVTANPQSGSLGALVQAEIEDFKAVNDRVPSGSERSDIILKAREKYAKAGANARPVNDALAQRAKRLQLVNPSLSPEQAQTMAAKLIERENGQKLNASLTHTYATIASDKERLAMFKEMAPLTLMAKELGIEEANKKLDADPKTAGGATKTLELAKRIAQGLMKEDAKRGVLSRIFGATAPTEDELVDKYLLEVTQQDPDVIRAKAAEENAPKKTPAKATSSGAVNPFLKK